MKIFKYNKFRGKKLSPESFGNREPTYEDIRNLYVSKQLDEMFRVWMDYEEIAGELERLRAENKILKDLLDEFKKKLTPINQLRSLILELSRTGNTEIVESLINKYMALVVHLSEK